MAKKLKIKELTQDEADKKANMHKAFKVIGAILAVLLVAAAAVLVGFYIANGAGASENWLNTVILNLGKVDGQVWLIPVLLFGGVMEALFSHAEKDAQIEWENDLER